MIKEQIKILLIQFRPDDMKNHEFNMLVKFAGLRPDQFVRVDALNDQININKLDNVDVLVLGGAGDYLVSSGEIQDKIDAILPLVKEARERSTPTLGICFGAHVMTVAFGGKIEKDEVKAETGTYEIAKNSFSKSCPIFSRLPEKFDAQLGHKDHITQLPPRAVSLASSKNSEHQAYTFPGEPIYALTFHPELDKQALSDRLDYYADMYGITPEILESLKKDARETPEAVKILHLFLKYIVEEGDRYKSGLEHD
ncbi:MAG: gamma-glutamyl-gamma-aminobutyrate hydrolase family protein [Patescibacteria group bacterium]